MADCKMSWGKNKNFAASKKKKLIGCPIGHSRVEEVPKPQRERPARRALQPASRDSAAAMRGDKMRSEISLQTKVSAAVWHTSDPPTHTHS